MGLGRQVIYPANPSSGLTSPRPVCFLFDNGSVRGASTLSLRHTAEALASGSGARVFPVSLLHSTNVDASELGGLPARLLEPALQAYLSENPTAKAVLAPLFFGPSGALTEYLPRRLEELRAKFPRATVHLAEPLVVPEKGDTRIAEALASAARRILERKPLDRSHVVLVDHGSPQRAVGAVRDWLGDRVRELLGHAIGCLGVASMERRPEPEYAFNEPLLARLLREPPFNQGDVVILLQFLSPGRHAGPEGDIAQICAAAQREQPLLRTHLTDPIANDPRVVDVLLQRYEEAAAKLRA